jgi:hypothetical protein
MILLTAVVYYGRLTYHYEVVNKAARRRPLPVQRGRANLKNPSLAVQENNLVLAIVQAELSALGGSQPLVFVYCDTAPCGH